jgi:hypothetical protein
MARLSYVRWRYEVYFPNQAYLINCQNLDRRPPTLLKQFTLLHSLFSPPLEALPTSILLLPGLNELILVTSPPVATHQLRPLSFFDAKRDGLQTISSAPESSKFGHLPISKLSRSPEGHAVAVMREGAGEIWQVKKSGGLRLLQQFEKPKEARLLVFHSGMSTLVFKQIYLIHERAERGYLRPRTAYINGTYGKYRAN